MKKIKDMFANQAYMIKKTWEFSKSFLIFKVALAILSGIVPTINVYLVKVMIDKIVDYNLEESFVMIGIIFIIDIGYILIRTAIGRAIGVKQDLFRNALLFDLHQKTVNMDSAIIFTPEMTQKKEMATRVAADNIATKYLDSTLAFFSAIISIISLGYVLLYVSPYIYLVILIMSILKIVTIINDKKLRFNNSIDMAPLNTRITYYMTMLSDEKYADDMRMYSISNWTLGKYKKIVKDSHNLFKRLLNKTFRNSTARSVISSIENAIFYIFLALQMVFNGLSFANFSMTLSALRTVSNSIGNIANNVIELGDNSLYMNVYRDYLKTKNKIAIENKGINAKNIMEKEEIFRLNDVSFSYPGSNINVLQNINLTFEKNKFYVIVGENGEGKTTLTRLLCRLYDPVSGEILYNNVNIKDVEYRSYRESIGIVFQDYKYYNLSIAENVAIDKYDNSEEVRVKIYECLCLAGLKSKIDSLPKGIDTELGRIFDEEGVLLSGGEIQKIALARMLFQDSPIVILDEPSSALDAFAEDDLIRTFNNSLRGKTVFYISHRLSVAKYADKVLYLHNHKIEGFDTHENLMLNCPQYERMYNVQAKHYTE